MRRLLIVLFSMSIVFFNPLFSQVYFPFPITNAAWNTVGDNDFTSDEWHFRYAISGDTVINSTLYSKIYKMYDSTILHPNSIYFAALRENDNKQVYCLIPGFEESILYDFGLEIGDTVWFDIGGGLCYNGVEFWEESHYRIVTAVDSFLLETNQYRKSWEIEGFMGGETWVEGIGSINWYGLFNPLISDIALCGDSYQFACFKRNDIVFYLNNPFCDQCFCDLFTGITQQKINKSEKITLYPNPSNNKISIDFSQPDYRINKLLIFNHIGNIVHEETRINNQIIEISIGHFKSGLYTIRFFDEAGQVIASEKMIIK